MPEMGGVVRDLEFGEMGRFRKIDRVVQEDEPAGRVGPPPESDEIPPPGQILLRRPYPEDHVLEARLLGDGIRLRLRRRRGEVGWEGVGARGGGGGGEEVEEVEVDEKEGDEEEERESKPGDDGFLERQERLAL